LPKKLRKKQSFRGRRQQTSGATAGNTRRPKIGRQVVGSTAQAANSAHTKARHAQKQASRAARQAGEALEVSSGATASTLVDPMHEMPLPEQGRYEYHGSRGSGRVSTHGF
jgi:hypothetical protein